MSKETFRAIREAVQAHIDDQRKEGAEPEMLVEVAIGYATFRHEDGKEFFSYNYIVDEASSPHSSVGLFAMASSQLDIDLDPK